VTYPRGASKKWPLQRYENQPADDVLLNHFQTPVRIQLVVILNLCVMARRGSFSDRRAAVFDELQDVECNG
jgi:hypothetical protein